MPDCWDADDYSWLDSYSGWHGPLHGCNTSIFFIHGKKIREQRHIPADSYDLCDLPSLLAKWGEGLPNPRLVWSEDTGGGDAGLWIEGERDPNSEDLQRLEEVRARLDRNERRDWERLNRRYGKEGL